MLKLKDIHNKVKHLATETDRVKRSTFFKDYLNVMSRFWNYSHYNQLLIYFQYPKATKVAGYTTWKRLNRKIKKGEKAIKILAPIIIEDDEIIYFKPVSVFDISQTKGEPLPRLDIDIKGESKRHWLNNLLSYCSDTGIKVTFKELNDNFYGFNRGNTIVINSSKSINTQINTLVHELAHALMHKDSKCSTKTKEIQAEAVAYVVCKTIGLEPKSFNYLAIYDAGKENILDNLEIISKFSKKILDAIFFHK
ncbi:ImmA/IrrE family metallo-endopeptidase [Candidatus Woesearchaeota archaeon]|nr:MAG: ImmA/IrrE family metallo-endopeptidase [Candidatus Woesearchaeota archaeon]